MMRPAKRLSVGRRAAFLLAVLALASITALHRHDPDIVVAASMATPRIYDGHMQHLPLVETPACPCSIWDSSATPALKSDPDIRATELGVKFRAAVAGTITGIRFYKGPSNTGRHTGSLWSSIGTRLATVTFTGETASGWQQASFNSPVAIEANTIYVASYLAPNGRYSVTEGHFTAGVSNGPLYALRDGESGGNGVYRYTASSAFPSQTFLSSNYWVDVIFNPSPAPRPTATPPVAPTPAPSIAPIPGPTQPPTTRQPTLLASYVVRPYPEYANSRYEPRAETAAPFTGWDRLSLPGKDRIGIHTTLSNADWLTLVLHRPAALAVVWRGHLQAPTWLSTWTRAADVTVAGERFPTYRMDFPAGTVTLGGVNNPGVTTPQRTYMVLLAEANGTPSRAPAVPSGREPPKPNQPCPAWVHAQYVAAGPDGKTYPTWHPQIDPVYWCYFQHEHGSDPELFMPGYRPLYGYTAAAMSMTEAHPGFKTYVFDDRGGHRWLLTNHFGTGSLARACVRHHTVDIAVADPATGTLVADLHLMGDFGKSVVNSTDEPLTPPDCPDQASKADTDNSYGVRKLPVASRGGIGYEPWRLDDRGNVLGFDGAALTFNTPGAAIICNDLRCDRPVSTGATGEFRFFTYTKGFGMQAGANTGTFYTDAMGMRRMSPGQSGAVRQYVEPELRVTVPILLANAECVPEEPWRAHYVCTAEDAPNGTALNLEGGLRIPN